MWSGTVSEQHKLQLNKLLRKIFCPNYDKINWQFRILSIRVLRDLQSSPAVVTEDLMGWVCNWDE